MRVHSDIAGELFEDFEAGKPLRASILLHRKIDQERCVNLD